MPACTSASQSPQFLWKRLPCFIFTWLVQHKKAVGHWKTHSNNIVNKSRLCANAHNQKSKVEKAECSFIAKKVILLHSSGNCHFFFYSGGVKPHWAELPVRAFPLCTWMIKRDSNGKPRAHEVSGRGLDCPLNRNESLRLSENPLTRLVLNWLMKIHQSLAQGEDRNHNLCLLGTTVTKTAPRQPLSDFNLIFCLIFVSTSKARKMEHR